MIQRPIAKPDARGLAFRHVSIAPISNPSTAMPTTGGASDEVDRGRGQRARIVVPKPALHNLFGQTALPEANHPPSQAPEHPANPPIPKSVLIELLHPEQAVRSGWDVTAWTAVPKTPVDKHSESTGGPHEIRLSREGVVPAPSGKSGSSQ